MSSSSNNNTTRVFLRVKRRRPTSKTTFHDIANSTNNFINHTSDSTLSSGPDRIQLTLPCISSSTNDEHGGGRNKKRRKMNELVKRLDSAVSLHDNNPNSNNTTDNNNKSAKELQKLDREYANLKSNNSSGGDMVQTPARRGASQNINSSFNNSKMPPQDRPSSNNLSTNNTNSTENNAVDMEDNNAVDSNDNIPAPPTKPKRTVTFRKITNLQKQLALDPCNPDIGCGNAALKVGCKEDERDLALSNSASSSRSVSNEDGEEKKSKWLRIVDVMLKEEESDGSDVNNAGDDSSMRGGEGPNAMIGSDNNKSTIPKVVIQGSGQRIRRMRPRPTDNEEEEEKKCDDSDAVNGAAANNSSGMRQKKRRKLSGKWVVEQTRNVLECDFTMESANTSSFTHHIPSNIMGLTNNNNNSMNNNNNSSMNTNNNNHGLSPETIKLIDYSLQSINNQNTGSVSPHLAFLLHDPRLEGKGKLFVDYQLGSNDNDGRGSGGRREEETEGKGRTILHMASLYGDLTSIRTLLTTYNANPTIKDSQGNTPSILARQGLNSMAYSISSPDSVARRNSYNVIEALIEGKVQSWNEKNQQKTSISSTTTTAPATSAQPTQLDEQTVQLLNYSLSSIQKQNGGSILHYISFLKSDHRLQYNTNTERAKLIVNYTYLPSHELIPEVDVRNSSHIGKGRTILHYAALYGDFVGVTTLLNDMGANPTIKDDDGNTPAMLGGYKAVVDVLKEGERRWNASVAAAASSKKDDKDDEDGEYYYEVSLTMCCINCPVSAELLTFYPLDVYRYTASKRLQKWLTIQQSRLASQSLNSYVQVLPILIQSPDLNFRLHFQKKTRIMIPYHHVVVAAAVTSKTVP